MTSSIYSPKAASEFGALGHGGPQDPTPNNRWVGLAAAVLARSDSYSDCALFYVSPTERPTFRPIGPGRKPVGSSHFAVGSRWVVQSWRWVRNPPPLPPPSSSLSLLLLPSSPLPPPPPLSPPARASARKKFLGRWVRKSAVGS
jgi:hypothetical protein